MSRSRNSQVKVVPRRRAVSGTQDHIDRALTLSRKRKNSLTTGQILRLSDSLGHIKTRKICSAGIRKKQLSFFQGRNEVGDQGSRAKKRVGSGITAPGSGITTPGIGISGVSQGSGVLDQQNFAG